MNYRIRFATTIVALTLLAVSSGQFRVAANQKPRKLTFEFLLCGIGAFGSHQTYKASDGTTVSVDSQMYVTLDDAKKRIANELKVARRIHERKDLLDAAGKKVGERFVFVTSNARNQTTVRLSIDDTFVYKIEAASLRHINAFRAWESATEQRGGPERRGPLNCELRIANCGFDSAPPGQL